MDKDLSIFFSTESIIVFILVLTRLSGMLATAPLFSTFPIPMQVKAGIAALSAFIMYPFVLQAINFDLPNNLILLSILLIKELLVGVMIGFCASLIFTAVQIGGQILSMEMGLAIAEALDPTTGQQSPIVGQFYLFIASMTFIYLNGHQWLFSTVQESYLSIPAGLDFNFTTRLIEQIVYFTSQLFTIAFSIVMPIFQILFIVTLLMGFMAKVMPQMNIFMVAMPVKIYIGLILVSMLMPPTMQYLMRLISTMLEQLHSIFVF
ncbi:MAG: flagellar biosynthetic protein FliR [Candidatus Melainabacteria bacterium GWF2_37_15]|nr:MAG: flagellar biosynthetic protein FliR [Candidatus Melainabacteria bacterium GWF2_37_15]